MTKLLVSGWGRLLVSGLDRSLDHDKIIGQWLDRSLDHDKIIGQWLDRLLVSGWTDCFVYWSMDGTDCFYHDKIISQWMGQITFIRTNISYIFMHLFVQCIVPWTWLGTMHNRNVRYYYPPPHPPPPTPTGEVLGTVGVTAELKSAAKSPTPW